MRIHRPNISLKRTHERECQAQNTDLRRVVKAHMYLRRLVRDGVLPVLENGADPSRAMQPSLVQMLRLLVSDTQLNH